MSMAAAASRNILNTPGEDRMMTARGTLKQPDAEYTGTTPATQQSRYTNNQRSARFRSNRVRELASTQPARLFASFKNVATRSVQAIPT
jgi:hypothetical protein